MLRSICSAPIGPIYPFFLALPTNRRIWPLATCAQSWGRFCFESFGHVGRLKAISIGEIGSVQHDFIRRAFGLSASAGIAGARRIKSSTFLYTTVETVLDYRSASLPREPDLRLGRAAAALAVVSALGILYCSHHFRMAMETWRGNWCDTSTAVAGSKLHCVPFLFVAPAIACIVAMRARAGI
jgi:hypothetical protein